MWTTLRDPKFWGQAPTRELLARCREGEDKGLRSSVFALGDPSRASTPTLVVIEAERGAPMPCHGEGLAHFTAVLLGSLVADDVVHHEGAMSERQPGECCPPRVAGPDGVTIVQLIAGLPGTGPSSECTVVKEAWRGPHDDAFWNHVPADRLLPLVVDFDALGPDSPFGYHMFALGDADRDDIPTAVVFKAGSDFVLPSHAHGCWRWEIVLEGSVLIEDGTTLGPGSIMTAPPSEFYGPFRAGPEGYTVIEIFSELVGAHEITWSTPDGPQLQRILTESSTDAPRL
jgi:hypothetical protein